LVAGGGARSELWCQILADVLTRDVVQTDGGEQGARGAAMLAASAVGPELATLQRAWVGRGRTLTPGPAAQVYASLFEVYLATVEAQESAWDLRAETIWPSDSDHGRLG
jgi:sugar (pentulose or hexulose) kinase